MKCYNHYHHLCYHSNDYKWSLCVFCIRNWVEEFLMHQRLSYYEKMVINNWQNTYSAWPLIRFSQSYRLCLDYPRSRFFCYFCTRVGCSMRIVMLDFLFVLVENDWYGYRANLRTKFFVCSNEGELNLCGWVVTEVLHIRPLVSNKICSNQIASSSKGFLRGKLIYGVLY